MVLVQDMSNQGIWQVKWIFRIVACAGLLALTVPAGADTRAGKNALDAKEYDKAVKELMPEAEKGDVEAIFLLGQMQQAGWGVPKDLKKATEWFGKAAQLGHLESQKEYGAALALGDGVEQDVNEGLKWLMIAAQKGHEGAAQYAAQLAKHFPRNVIAAARRGANEWGRQNKPDTTATSPK